MTAACMMPGCTDRTRAKGLCRRHYQQQWRTGDPQIARPNPHGTVEERFTRYVKPGPPDTCWEWTGRRDKDGYGTLRVGRTMVRAHRYAYERRHGPIPDALLVRHTCDNPPCCNDAHLVAGSHLANMQDRLAAGHYPRRAARDMATPSLFDLIKEESA